MHINLRDDIEPPEKVETVKLNGEDRPPERAAVEHSQLVESDSQSHSEPSPLTGDRLFQTHDRVEKTSRNYLKALGVVLVLVAVGVGIFFYVTLPGMGDRVRAPQGLEDAVRNNFIEVQKRDATDIEFYFCESYYWARVNVEKRPDITTNPIYLIGTYKARATAVGDAWTVTAEPITSPDADVPCK
ncbi:MAG: hypothetical protein WBO10_01100 [Pyrinomonadaceae bacterium]